MRSRQQPKFMDKFTKSIAKNVKEHKPAENKINDLLEEMQHKLSTFTYEN